MFFCVLGFEGEIFFISIIFFGIFWLDREIDDIVVILVFNELFLDVLWCCLYVGEDWLLYFEFFISCILILWFIFKFLIWVFFVFEFLFFGNFCFVILWDLWWLFILFLKFLFGSSCLVFFCISGYLCVGLSNKVYGYICFMIVFKISI